MTYLAVLKDIGAQVADPELDSYKERAKDHFLRALAGMITNDQFSDNDIKGYIKLKTDLVFSTNPYDASGLNIFKIINVICDPQLPNQFSAYFKQFEDLKMLSQITALQPTRSEVIIYPVGANIYALYKTVPGAESLNETDFATNTNWAVTDDFDAGFTGEKAVYVYASHRTSTLTQTSGGNLLIDGIADKWYKFTYTIDETTPFNGDGVATITNSFALVAKKLNLTPGTHTVYFKSAAAPGDFVISIVSGSDSEGTFSFDDFSLKQMINGSNFNVASDTLIMKYVEDIDGTGWGDSTDLTASPIYFTDNFIRRGIDIASKTLLDEVRL